MTRENPETVREIETLQKEMKDLRALIIEGPESLGKLTERVESLEESNPRAFAFDPFTPDIERSGDLPDTRITPSAFREDEFEIVPFDIEFGKPIANVTTDVATVTLQPCDQGGNSFASAATVTNYVAADRQILATAGNGWTTATILSFIRFSPFVSGAPNIEGVLIGNVGASVPSGIIVEFEGFGASIPTGWTLCDDSVDSKGNRTPDLSGLFIVGFDSSDGDYDAIAKTGGFKLHGPTENEHAVRQMLTSTAGGVPDSYTPKNDSAVDVDTDNRPPYFVLAFIRKD